MLITLRGNSQGWNGTATIDTIGAQLISFKDPEGKEYIWQRDPQFWGRCSPLLFPIVGNLRNDEIMIEGRSCHITKHGFCRDMDFAVTEQSETSVTMEIRDNEDTRAIYPYSFRLAMTYTLAAEKLTVTYRVLNTDNRTIHYCIGAHPGFNCPMEDGASFDDYVLEFEKEETASSMTYDLANSCFDPANRAPRLDHARRLPISRGLFKDDAVYFDDLNSEKVSLIHKDSGHGVEVAYPGFETVAFWTPYPSEAPFVCVEPWNGSGVYADEDNEFTHKNHVQTLEEGGSREYGLIIRII